MKPTSFTLERCQHGGNPGEASACYGEAGYGVYAYLPSTAMREYYSANGESVYQLTLKEGEVVDLCAAEKMSDLLAFASSHFKKTALQMPGYQIPAVSASNIQRFGSVVEQYIRLRHPNAVVYVVPHQGPGIPTGKQAVIRVIGAFEVKPVETISQKNTHITNTQKGLKP